MGIDKLKIKNIKCFSEVESTIRPITVVVGENNTGKTTFLSVYKLMHDLLYTDQPIHSSIEDLLKRKTYKYLGGSKNIKRDQSKTEDIIIGAVLKIDEKDVWNVEYVIENGKFCRKIIIQCSKDKIEMDIRENNTIKVIINGNKIYDATTPLDFSINFFGIISFLSKLQNIEKNDIPLSSKIINLLKFKEVSKDLKNISCSLLEPVHSAPKSQYNPDQIETTDSSHVLCKIAEMKKNKDNWSKIVKEFTAFGKNSKLFQSLDIKTYGSFTGSPFSIEVEAGGVKKDITNVGYGVSQFLPVLANMFISDNTKDNTFLIQQPEGHLHPRVEAEFATLMTQMVRKYNKKCRFICETHSDCMIQRIRIEIKEKKINPEDFLILYFELDDGGAKIYPITIDSNGNMQGQSDGYQKFFLLEDYKLLGLKE